MEVEIYINKPNKENHFFKSDRKFPIELPLKFWDASKFGGNFSLYQDGTGAYCGPSQMFGGPQGGDLIFFKNGTGRHIYALMTSMTQNWDTRSGKIHIVCFEDELIPRITEALKTDPQPYEDIIKNLKPWMGLDKSVDLCFDIARSVMNNYIDMLVNNPESLKLNYELHNS